MKYVYQYKNPFDEVAEKLQMLPRLQLLFLGINRENYDIQFLEFLLEQILKIPGIKHIRCFHVPKPQPNRDGSLQDPLLLHLQQRLHSRLEQHMEHGRYEEMEMSGMSRLLQAMKFRQSLQTPDGQGPSYLNPADILDD